MDDRQAPHANPVKGTSVEEEEHPTTTDLMAALIALGQASPKLTRVNCARLVELLEEHDQVWHW